MVYARYCASYPKRPCVKHAANIWCPCCMMSLCSRTFYFFLLHPVINVVTTPSDVTVWLITSNTNPRVLKIEKCKIIKRKRKWEMKKENKIKSIILYLYTKLLLLPVVSCHRFCSFFLLVASSSIKMLLVSISYLVLEIILLLLRVLRHLFLFWILLFSLVGKELVDLLSCLWVPRMLVDVLYSISILSCPLVHLTALLYDWSFG